MNESFLTVSKGKPDDGSMPEIGEREANAQLIAAAPELLSLCVQMRDWLRPEVVKEPDRSFFWKLQSIIDKATKS